MSDQVFDRIQSVIDGSDIVLFMKGSATMPQCGFSAAVVQVLNHFKVDFQSVDVLRDPEVRDGIKQFSEWPTIPQLYVKGEFIGGCDIVREMAVSGELAELFTEKGISPKI